MRLLVIRLSALGDVALLQPVLRARAEANADVTFLIAAPALLQPLFADISNVEFVSTPRHLAAAEMAALWDSLAPDAVADLHGIPRVRRALRCLRRLHPGHLPVAHVTKNRIGRWRLTRRWMKCMTPLPEAWRRYDDVFTACHLNPAPALSRDAAHCWKPKANHSGRHLIGLAPGAQHAGKRWPSHHVEALIADLSKRGDCDLLLFGGPDERNQMEVWAAHYPHTRSLAATGSFADEMEAIRQLDVMVCMDSANMHFASIQGVPVVSLWGATHPAAGFYGWRQNSAWAVQLPLHCRPCSAYGQRRCRYGDYRCLDRINPEQVKEKIDSLLVGKKEREG